MQTPLQLFPQARSSFARGVLDDAPLTQLRRAQGRELGQLKKSRPSVILAPGNGRRILHARVKCP